MEPETIVAAATPPGRGGVGVVRISGARVPAIAEGLLGAMPAPRLATRARFRDASDQAIDDGFALYFPSPRSYTAEHVLELHCHGGAVIVEALIERAVGLGARRARAGEFTERAFLNGKLDLTQAEAVADLIDAASATAARAALRSLAGEFSAAVRALGAELAALRVQVEAGIDFAHEDIEVDSGETLRVRLQAARSRLGALLVACGRGRRLTEGLRVVIAGAPNAGKSTLLNRLAGHDAAIVTPIAGTTRDVLREQVLIEGIPLELLDTAGIRAQAGDAIEAEGMSRARAAMAGADRILFIVDAMADPTASLYRAEMGRMPAQVPVTLVFNKIDLRDPSGLEPPPGAEVLKVCALYGAGLEGLRTHLRACAGAADAGEGLVSARARHVDALKRCQERLEAALRVQEPPGGAELLAEELRLAQRHLEELLGAGSNEELLGRIFSTFCIGK